MTTNELKLRFGVQARPMPVSKDVKVYAKDCNFDHEGGCRTHMVVDGDKVVVKNSYHHNSTLGLKQDWTKLDQITAAEVPGVVARKGYVEVPASDCHWIELPKQEVLVEDTLSGGI